MESLCYIAVFLSALIPFSFGNAGLENLQRRIEILERRDIEKSAEINALKKQAKVSDSQIHRLTISNANLRKQFTAVGQKIEIQQDITASLNVELSHQRSVADDSRHKAQILEFKVRKMDTRIQRMTKHTANLRNKFSEYLDANKAIHGKSYKVKYSTSNIDRNTYSNNFGLSVDQTSMKDELLLESTQVAERKINENTGVIEGELPTKAAWESTNTQSTRKQRIEKTEKPYHPTHRKRFVTTSTVVAFHAVVSPNVVQHHGTNGNIRFDTILQNEGGGYHNQHGLFIAPKPGFYLFSVTIAVEQTKRLYANVLKNGARLASVAGDGGQGGYLDQGSVTLVTKLNTGDEVWVVHTSPTDGSIYGNRFTSFTGVLIVEYE